MRVKFLGIRMSRSNQKCPTVERSSMLREVFVVFGDLGMFERKKER